MATSIILSVYNQMPALYNNIVSMTKDLKRIADLGFNAVWINPIYSPCQVNPIPGMADRINCPYAMQDQTISPRYAANRQQVKDYTKTAIDLNMVPIFDLVGRHVAIDNALVTGDPSLKKNHNVDSSRWFKRHPNGNLIMHHMNEHLEPTGDNPWCDIASFNYDDPDITDEIFTYFWTPFLNENMVELGFKGIRLDAPLMIPPQIVHRLINTVKSLAKNAFPMFKSEDLIVIAETVGIGDEETILSFKECGITHPMNSSYWMPGPLGTKDHDHSLWLKTHNWFTHNKGLLQQLGPTLGYPGSHDEPRYIQELLDKGVLNEEQLAFYMREKIAATAFSSEGGWILLYGDEFGAHEKINLFNSTPKEYHGDKRLQRFDLSSFIQAINNTLKTLPSPTFPQWQQRIFLKSFPEAVIFLTHQGEGYSGKPYLIIANPAETKHFTLSKDIIHEIVMKGGNEKHDISPTSIFLCGDHFNIQPDVPFDSYQTGVYHCSSTEVILLNQNINHTPIKKDISDVTKPLLFPASFFKNHQDFQGNANKHIGSSVHGLSAGNVVPKSFL